MKFIENFLYKLANRIIGWYFDKYPSQLPFYAYYTLEAAKNLGFPDSLMESSELFAKSCFELHHKNKSEKEKDSRLGTATA